LTIELYDLAGAEDDRRFSPNCWRVTIAIAAGPSTSPHSRPMRR
jgi:hypothetical protein